MTTETSKWHTVAGVNTSTTKFPVIAKAGDERLVILDTGKGYRGVDIRCPHLQASMTAGILMGDGTMVRCPKHNFIFRLSDGKGVNCVGLTLKVYKVRQNEKSLDVLIESK